MAQIFYDRGCDDADDDDDGYAHRWIISHLYVSRVLPRPRVCRVLGCVGVWVGLDATPPAMASQSKASQSKASQQTETPTSAAQWLWSA